MERRRATSWSVAALLLWLTGLPGAVVHADLVEGFESIDTAWKRGESDANWSLLGHRRVFDVKHGGHASERIEFRCGPGTYAHLIFPVSPTRVIDELAISVWVRSDVPGVQLLARVVFPRTRDPVTGRPRSTWLRGTASREGGKWEPLRLNRPREQLERLVFALRSQYGGKLDSAEAYIDRIGLNVYLGPGVHTVWTDDLSIRGQVLRRVGSIDPAGGTGLGAEAGMRGSTRCGPDVRVVGDVFMLAGRPFAVRAVDHHGEILADLRRLGFNTVVLSRPVTTRDQREAQEAGVWLIAPPDRAAVPSGSIDRVIAWLIPGRLDRKQLADVQRRVDALHASGDTRPVVGAVSEAFASYGQILDVVLLDRPVLGTTRTLDDYLYWLRLARSELPSATPVWVVVSGELPETVRRQVVSLGGDEDALMPTLGALHTIVLRAVQQGCRGVWIRSRRSLQTPDAVTGRRRLIYRRATRVLELLGPWIAAGRIEHGVESSSRRVRSTWLATDRARMLLAVLQGPGAHCVPPPAESTDVRLNAPGAPATDEAYLVSWTGLERIYSHRGLGLDLTVPDRRSTTMVLLTQDPSVVRFVSQTAMGQRQAMLEETRRLYRWEADWTEAVLERLRPILKVPLETEGAMPSIRRRYAYLEQLVRSRDSRRAFRVAWELEQAFRQLQRGYWESALQGISSPGTSPATMTFYSLPQHWRLVRTVGTATWSVNQLPGGDFESLPHLRRVGWSYQAGPLARDRQRVMIAYEGMRDGRGALRIESQGGGGGGSQAETALRIVSPSVAVPANQLVRITGWLRIEQPVSGHPDGLTIYDTLGGPALGLHKHRTSGWEEVAFYRVCREPSELRLVIELNGRGAAVLDTFQVVLAPAAN